MNQYGTFIVSTMHTVEDADKVKFGFQGSNHRFNVSRAQMRSEQLQSNPDLREMPKRVGLLPTADQIAKDSGSVFSEPPLDSESHLRNFHHSQKVPEIQVPEDWKLDLPTREEAVKLKRLPIHRFASTYSLRMYQCSMRTRNGFPRDIAPKDELGGRGSSQQTRAPRGGQGNARGSATQTSNRPNIKRRATTVDDVLLGDSAEDVARAKAYLTSLHVEQTISERPEKLKLSDDNDPTVQMIPMPLAAEMLRTTPIHPILGVTDETGAITERSSVRKVKREPVEGEAEGELKDINVSLYQLRQPESALITASLLRTKTVGFQSKDLNAYICADTPEFPLKDSIGFTLQGQSMPLSTVDTMEKFYRSKNLFPFERVAVQTVITTASEKGFLEKLSKENKANYDDRRPKDELSKTFKKFMIEPQGDFLKRNTILSLECLGIQALKGPSTQWHGTSLGCAIPAVQVKTVSEISSPVGSLDKLDAETAVVELSTDIGEVPSGWTQTDNLGRKPISDQIETIRLILEQKDKDRLQSLVYHAKRTQQEERRETTDSLKRKRPVVEVKTDIDDLF